MTHVIASHKVSDFAAWKKVFDQFAETRKSSGETSYQILHQSNDPNDLVMVFGWDNQANAEKFFQSEELKNAMQNAGVTEPPQVQFVNEVASGKL